MRRIGLVSLLLLGLTPAAIAADNLPKVASVAELQALPAVQAAGGWDVRVGYADPGAEAGPWILVYCDARLVRKDGGVAPKEAPEKPLGPLTVMVSWDNVLKSEPQMSVTDRVIKEGIYCMSVPTTKGDVCHVNATDRAGVVVAHLDLDLRAKEIAPLYWQQFAVLYDFGKGKAKAVSSDSCVMPVYSGWEPIWSPTAAQANDAAGLKMLFNLGLPGTVPSAEPWFSSKAIEKPNDVRPFFPLQLSLEGEKFLIKAGGRQLTDMPDDLVLARWWVNGKAIVASTQTARNAVDEGRRVSKRDQLEVLFGYPDSLGKVKEGDKIALQLLYSPGGFESGDDRMMALQMVPMHDEAGMPMWSNRAEFVLTKELMAAREKMVEKP